MMESIERRQRVDRLLVVDDDERIRDLLNRYLTQEGFEVTTAENGRAMDVFLLRGATDLLVLDLMMPGEDGLSICRRLRSAGNFTPIIMLTAKGEDVDRIVGLEVGADDYLAKPFNPRELLARIHAVLRRRPAKEEVGREMEVEEADATATPPEEDKRVSFGPFVLDFGRRTLFRNGEIMSMTTGEFATLKVLADHPYEPMTREQLALLSRGRVFEPFDRSMDVQISRLRRLVEDDTTTPRYIQTVWGVGYVFVPNGGSGRQTVGSGKISQRSNVSI